MGNAANKTARACLLGASVGIFADDKQDFIGFVRAKGEFALRAVEDAAKLGYDLTNVRYVESRPFSGTPGYIIEL